MNRTVKSIKKQLKMSISQVTDAPESYVRSPGKDFSRNRKLTMQKMVESILVMGGSDLKCELMDFFKFSPDTPSNAAFVKRRGLISSKAFEHIFNSFTAACNQLKLFKGYRLLAVDGSDLHIPTNKEEPDNFYPAVNGQKSYSLLHLNAMYDLLQNIYIDAVIQESRKQNEHAAFVKMIDRYDHSVPSIFIADRGFESYNNIAHVQESGNYYLIRIKNAKKGFCAGLDLPDSDEFDSFFSCDLTKKKTAETIAAGQKFISHSVNFDYLPKRCRKYVAVKPYHMEFRIVRFNLSDSVSETLITNLPADSFPPDILKHLYSLRWGIETSFRSLKYSLALLSFHSKKTENICQEVFARLTMYNFAELITSLIVIKRSRKSRLLKVNFSAAVHLSRQFFLGNISPPELVQLLSHYTLPVRPAKSVPRKNIKGKSAVSFIYRIA